MTTIEAFLLFIAAVPLSLIAVYFISKAARMGWLRANELHKKRRRHE